MENNAKLYANYKKTCSFSVLMKSISPCLSVNACGLCKSPNEVVSPTMQSTLYTEHELGILPLKVCKLEVNQKHVSMR